MSRKVYSISPESPLAYEVCKQGKEHNLSEGCLMGLVLNEGLILQSVENVSCVWQTRGPGELGSHNQLVTASHLSGQSSSLKGEEA